MPKRLAYVKKAIKTVSYLLLFKAALGGAFAVLTICGVTFPYLGFDFTPARETAAVGVGSIAGLLSALRA